MNELHLFAGAGGGILGGLLLGHTPVCAVEIEPYCRRILLQRQRDGMLPRFPIWDDIKTFDGRPWRGYVDVVTGGFPCQDISPACGKGTGLEGKRSSLWHEMARVIREVRPQFCFVENSSLLNSNGLDVVLMDLASMGYDAEWCVLGAVHVNAQHNRERTWILASNPNMCCGGPEQKREYERPEKFSADRLLGLESRPEVDYSRAHYGAPEPRMARMVDDVANRVDRYKAIGNGQVPAVVELAWHVLYQRAAAGTLRKRPAQHTTAAVCNTAGH